jgi:glycine cleavage system H protein
MYPPEYRYSKDHEWVRDEEETVVVGITDFAQSELGDVVYVELPEVGTTFDTDDEVGTIESVKAVAEVYTPVGGEIVEVNETLVENPERVNEDPHGEGWLFRLRPSAPGLADVLMTAEAYEALLQNED